MTAVEIRNLVVEVNGYPVVDGLTMDIDEGDCVGVIGDHQDVLLLFRVISGFSLPMSGEIWVYNLPPRQAYQRALISLYESTNTSFQQPTLILLRLQPSAAIIIRNTNRLIEKFNKLVRVGGVSK
ncbi:MAG: hypothetical protein C4295_05655 [Candidatus Fervidibacterota bacterium]